MMIVENERGGPFKGGGALRTQEKLEEEKNRENEKISGLVCWKEEKEILKKKDK